MTLRNTRCPNVLPSERPSVPFPLLPTPSSLSNSPYSPTSSFIFFLSFRVSLLSLISPHSVLPFPLPFPSICCHLSLFSSILSPLAFIFIAVSSFPLLYLILPILFSLSLFSFLFLVTFLLFPSFVLILLCFTH